MYRVGWANLHNFFCNKFNRESTHFYVSLCLGANMHHRVSLSLSLRDRFFLIKEPFLKPISCKLCFEKVLHGFSLLFNFFQALTQQTLLNEPTLGLLKQEVALISILTLPFTLWNMTEKDYFVIFLVKLLILWWEVALISKLTVPFTWWTIIKRHFCAIFGLK